MRTKTQAEVRVRMGVEGHPFYAEIHELTPGPFGAMEIKLLVGAEACTPIVLGKFTTQGDLTSRIEEIKDLLDEVLDSYKAL